MELVSQHNHTGLSAHGEGTVAQVVQAALERGMTNIAFTEHYPLTLEVDPRNFVSMAPSAVEGYCESVLEQRALHPEMEILLGLELDWLGAHEDRTFTPEEFERYDIILGSVHFVDGWPFDDPAQAHHWEDVGADAIWKRYFEVWCEAATSNAPFNVMSHPDLVKKFGRYPSFNPQPLYSQAVEAVASSGRMVEVNTSGLYYACKEVFPAPEFLRELCRAGVPCTIGSDAHKPELVARGIPEGYAALYQAGYREVTLLLPGGGRRTIPLE